MLEKLSIYKPLTRVSIIEESNLSNLIVEAAINGCAKRKEDIAMILDMSFGVMYLVSSKSSDSRLVALRVACDDSLISGKCVMVSLDGMEYRIYWLLFHCILALLIAIYVGLEFAVIYVGASVYLNWYVALKGLVQRIEKDVLLSDSSTKFPISSYYRKHVTNC
jgi:hypothetical protein